MQNHLYQDHVDLSDSEIERAEHSAEQDVANRVCREKCPFCLNVRASTITDFISHVGMHMRTVSRAAIPQSAMSENTEAIEEVDSDEVEEEKNEGMEGSPLPDRATKKQLRDPQSGSQPDHHTCIQMLGKEHSDTLTSLNNLASVLSSQGEYKEAEEMHRQLLVLKERIPGMKHPDTLESINNLAEVLSSQGKYKEAEEMHR